MSLEDFPLHHKPIPEEARRPSFKQYRPEDINLAEELAAQYSEAKNLYETIKYQPDIPANQKAQVLNSLTSILVQITKSQEEVHSINKVKQIEVALIQTLKAMPESLQNAFYEAYEGNLNAP